MAHKHHLIFIYSDYYTEGTLKRPEEKKGHNAKLKKNYKKKYLLCQFELFFLIIKLCTLIVQG